MALAQTICIYIVSRRFPGPGCVRERRQWRRQNGNYVQRRVSGTRTFGRRAARARVLSVCVCTPLRVRECVFVCVDKHFKGSSPLHPRRPDGRSSLSVYIRTPPLTAESSQHIIYGLWNPVRRSECCSSPKSPSFGVMSPPNTHTHAVFICGTVSPLRPFRYSERPPSNASSEAPDLATRGCNVSNHIFFLHFSIYLCTSLYVFTSPHDNILLSIYSAKKSLLYCIFSTKYNIIFI